MKKLVAIILIFALFLPAAAFSEQEKDPIVGTWYAYFSIPGSPMEQSFPGYDYSVVLITFTDDHSVYFLELDFSGSNMNNNGYKVAGEWKKTGFSYEVSIISVGISNATIQDGMLNAAIFNSEVYMKFRKLESFNFYTEMYRK